MITVRSEHHLDRTSMIGLLLLDRWSKVSDLGRIEDPPDISRAEAEAAIRDELHFAGRYRLEFVEDHVSTNNDAEYGAAVEWAARQIDRLWPEMASKDPAEGVA
jgi:hypothetical protein